MTPKQRLRRRVADIAIGAAGYDFDYMGEFSTAELLSRFVPALQVVFGEQGQDWMWSASNLHRYENIDSTTDFLWKNGVRA